MDMGAGARRCVRRVGRPRRGAPGARTRASGALAREAALVLALYAVWRLAGRLSLMQGDGAMRRGRGVWETERLLGLPDETAVQDLVAGWDGLMVAMNEYYRWVHAPALVVTLVWLFVRHRAHDGRWRTALALTTAACLLVQFVPVSPPRMHPEFGFVDSALVHGQSVSGAAGGAGAWAAMPSVHVAWAAVVGCAVWTAARGPWRWIGPAHAVLTVVVVTATANHRWLDGLVAVGLLAVSLRLVPCGATARPPLTRRARTPAGDARAGRGGHPLPHPAREAADETT
jgi:hypothetical protein